MEISRANTKGGYIKYQGTFLHASRSNSVSARGLSQSQLFMGHICSAFSQVLIKYILLEDIKLVNLFSRHSNTVDGREKYRKLSGKVRSRKLAHTVRYRVQL